MEYKFEVTIASHDFMRIETTFVRVVAGSDAEAAIIAAQIAHATAPFECMPIDTFMTDFPI